jgi:hypothetical protein
MVADCVSPANSNPSGLKVSGPIDLNTGPELAACDAAGCAAGAIDKDAMTVNTTLVFKSKERMRPPFAGAILHG